MSKSEEKIMYTTGSANVETSIDALMEEELLLQQMDFNDHLDDNFNEDGDDDQGLIDPLNGPNEIDNINELNNDELPPEVRHYVKTLESQSAQLEKELLLCDEFLKDSLNQERAPINAVMPYDDAKLLADAAAEAGMTVEEFKHKVLKDLETDDFSEEMMDREYEEFTQMQKELADMTADIHEAMHRNDENELLAIEASCDENINNANNDTGEISSSLALRYLREHRLAISDTENKAGPLVSMAALSSMRDFIHQQLRKTEEGFHARQQNLVQSIERHKQEEEKRTLVEEERKNKLHLEQEGEEAALREREKCKQGRLEGELKVLDDQLAQELSYHQAEIKKLSEDLEAERTRYEAEHSHWLMSLEATRSHAALAIQRRYRGYRTRREMSATMKDLEEMKTLRKNERYKLRVLEVEYQMKYTTEQDRKKREEQAKKEAEEKRRQEEEERQQQAEFRRREEEERLAEETRKEAERKKEEKRLEEERKKEEMILEAERKKEEEKQRKEEEKRRKEEEKEKKKEEKKRLEEEKKRHKEEEKERKLEEKRKKEEEKKLKEEAEKTREEEERRRKSEELKNKEEAMRSKVELTKKSSAKDTSVSESQPPDDGTVIQAVDKASLQAGDWVRQQDGTEPDKPGLQVPHQIPAAAPTAASHSPRPPDFPPPHPLSTSFTAKTAPASPRPAPPPPQPMPPPLSEQQHMPHPAEIQRLAWIKSCTPWSKVSNEPWKLVVQSGQKVQKRPVSAKKKLAPIAESVVLTAAHAETLRQVSSVTLYDLPGCSLATLGQCWSLRYLTVTHCHLVCLDGISQCKHLHYVNAEHNNIEYIDLKDLGSLQVARLANNKVGAVHGLEGCVNLRWLDVSHNNITRLSGLSALRRLHTLNVSHNQLVGCEGLEEVVTLQQLDLSHNFLQRFAGIDKLCLLTRLDLSSNNLLEVPELKNQVLLQVLHLQENSIKSLGMFGQYWLPLLYRLNCSENMLESVEGLEKLILLRHLDISLNQITELESLTQGLQYNGQLECLDVEGNPVVEVYSNEYKSHISEALRSLKILNGNELMREGSETLSADLRLDQEFLQMCRNQIHLHDTLRKDFENQKTGLQSASQATSESVCHTHFSFCDTSFKMAAEHRSAHEYGYNETSGNLNKFKPSSSSAADHNGLDKSLAPQESMGKKIQDLPAEKTSNAPATSGVPNIVTGSEEKKDQTTQDVSRNNSLNRQHADPNNIKQRKVYKSSKTDVSVVKQKPVAMETSDSLSEFSDDDDGGNLVRGAGKPNLVPRPPRAPAKTSYVGQKDKFNMAVNENARLNSEFKQKVSVDTTLNGLEEEGNRNSNCSVVESEVKASKPQQSVHGRLDGLGQYVSEKDKFEMALQSQNQAKRPAEKSSQGQVKVMSHQPKAAENGRMAPPGVRADVIASKMTEGGTDDMFMDFNVDNLDDIDMEALDFDIEKYLEMGELDEFLESGWRPSDEPQLPQSSYPVLRNIPQNGNVTRRSDQVSRTSDQVSGPPAQPSQAWNVGLVTEPRGNNIRPFSGHGVVPPLAQPSPTPSTVASVAETIEGGSVRSKVDEIIEDWGFKDAHTAELMLARAKKMKYNTERKRKLSKLDPKQRLQLFRKLEESGRILSVRPPNVKTLPRKEYFQAREEETQRKELERRVEDHNRVGRTFEWIHTQVGDYPVSSSRINPGPAALYTNSNDVQGKVTDPRKTSPLSDHQSSAGSRAGLHQVRRLSLGDDYSGRSPSLPPIFQKDRLSFRDTPVEKSGGWGGGKKRSQKP